jgi:hypothetical protein
MKFLLPIGGNIPKDFGVLTTPSHMGIPSGISNGLDWAADNGAFTKKFNLDKYLIHLNLLEPYKNTCLFINLPDVLGSAKETIDNFYKYIEYFPSWKIGFVGQDGQENSEFPDANLWDTFFLGGTTEFKDGKDGLNCILRAMDLGKKIHIGRVNGWKRYHKFSEVEKGYKYEFTCDGTKNRFIGVEKTIQLFRSFKERQI